MFTHVLQAAEITCDQSRFLLTARAQELPLPRYRLRLGEKSLRIDQTERTSFERVCGTTPIVVSFYAGSKILWGADVKAAVGARKHVDVVHLSGAIRLGKR